MKKLIYLSVFALILGACGSGGGQSTEESVDETTDQMEETMDEMGDAAEETVDNIGDAAEEAANDMEAAADTLSK